MSSIPTPEYSKFDKQHHIRLRPGMYIGGTDKRALHEMLNWLLEFLAEYAAVGLCKHIRFELMNGNVIRIVKDGQGLPVDIAPDTDRTKMEVLLEGPESITDSIIRIDFSPDFHRLVGGFFHHGLTIPNSLCDSYVVETYQGGIQYRKEYSCGKPITPLLQTKTSTEELSGTTFIFHPDYSILDQNNFDLRMIEERCKAIARTVPGLTIDLKDLRVSPVFHHVFHYPDGMKALVDEVNVGAKVFHDVVVIHHDATYPGRYAHSEPLRIKIEIAFQFTDHAETIVKGFMTSVETQGGTHIKGFKSALLTCFEELLDDHRTLAWEDISPGLTAGISIWHPYPEYESTLRIAPLNPEIYGIVAGLIYSMFSGLTQDRQRGVIREIMERRGLIQTPPDENPDEVE